MPSVALKKPNSKDLAETLHRVQIVSATSLGVLKSDLSKHLEEI